MSNNREMIEVNYGKSTQVLNKNYVCGKDDYVLLTKK